jgi:uncharacterized protein YkwD
MEKFNSTQYPFSEWTNEEILKANTASNTSYLSEEEKEVIFVTNLSRVNGDLFSKTFVPYFMEKNQIKSSSYSKSLERDLKKNKNNSAFQPNNLLTSTAKGHALTSGKRGNAGHQGFDKRYKKVESEFGYFGENCDYGYKQGWEITVHLLIDEGVKSLGHRKSILSHEYTHVGVAIAPHKEYRYNCVMNFGG